MPERSNAPFNAIDRFLFQFFVSKRIGEFPMIEMIEIRLPFIRLECCNSIANSHWLLLNLAIKFNKIIIKQRIN